MANKKGKADPQHSKFSPITCDLKAVLRQKRLDAGYTMNPAAALLGISRKQLEDIETVRNYGAHIDLEMLAKMSIIYKCKIEKLLPAIPTDDANDDYLIRPRLRKGRPVTK